MHTRFGLSLAISGLLVLASIHTLAQSRSVNSTVSKPSVVPNLVKFSGTAKDTTGKPLTGTVGITFALYAEETGGAALWMETQNVKADANGHYNVSLGAEKALPMDLFASGEARWLGVQIAEQAEQPRVLLLSVPYALKAADAETIGGLPASAFMRASSGNGEQGAGAQKLPPTVHGNGTIGYVSLWTAKNIIDKSSLFQNGANVGVGTTTPGALFDVNGTANFRNTLTLFPNGAAPALALSGTSLSIDHTGIINFVPGQTFPGGGGGTITGVTAGTDLTGGGTSGNVTLNLNVAATDARYAQLGAANSFTKNNIFAGTVGIGTTAPAAQLDVEAPAAAATGILGVTSSTAFFAAGVLGHATGTSGVTRGVYGAADSPSGIGVHGIGQTGGQFETGTGSIFVGRGQGATRVTMDSLGNTYTSGALSTGGAITAGSGFFTSVTAGATGLFASSDTGVGVFGLGAIGLIGEGSTGVYGIATPGGTAGYFSGDVQLTGRITSYNNAPTVANGVPSIVSQYSFSSNGGGNNIYQTFYTPSSDGVYRVTAFEECLATSGGVTYFSLGFNWTLPTSGSAGDAVFGGNCLFLSGSHGSFVAHVKGGTPIQFNYAGMDAPFQVLLMVEKLL